MAQPDFWRRNWTMNLTRCMACGSAFNFFHGRYPSLSATRVGRYWRFRCPVCGRRSDFDLRWMPQPGHPVYSDAGRTLQLILSLPIAAALVTLLGIIWFDGSFYGPGPVARLLLMAYVLLFANLGVILGLAWHYRYRVVFQRIG